MFATVSSPCIVELFMPCTTVVTDPIATSPRVPALWAMSWVVTTLTVTVLFMTHSYALPSRGHCDTHLFKVKETSAPPVTIPPLPSVTPSAAWLPLPWRWFAILTKTPSISNPTTTAAHWNPRFSPAGSRTCWSTVLPVSPWAWPPTFPHTICGRLLQRRSGFWLTRSPPPNNAKPP